LRLLSVAVLATVLFTTSVTSVQASSKHHFSPAVTAARDFALKRIGATQFKCLDALWMRESSWNPKAHNKRSGAHGIPQAVPGAKMGKGWQTDPMVQVRWGLKYIHGRYRTACAALNHAYVTGWY